jgi:hypothetical protein
MFTPILLVLAKCGYLPANYSVASIYTQIDKLIIDSTENEQLIPFVQEINRAVGLTAENLTKDLSEEPGPHCPVLEVSLESSCRYKKCRHNNQHFSWNCSKLGCPHEEIPESMIEDSLQEFNTSINLLEDAFEPDFEYPKNLCYCVKCGKPTDVGIFGKTYKLCKVCQVSMNSVGTQAFLLEVRFGRPVKEIINYVIQIWDTVQQQAKVLGVRPENFQSLCSNYNINMKRYRQVGDSRFINPFLNRKKGRPLIDSYLLRLYSLHLKTLQHEPIRREVRKLEEFLLSEANNLLRSRELELFDIPIEVG